jgi:hypothetical protein
MRGPLFNTNSKYFLQHIFISTSSLLNHLIHAPTVLLIIKGSSFRVISELFHLYQISEIASLKINNLNQASVLRLTDL